MTTKKRGRPVGSKNRDYSSLGLAKAIKPFQKDVVSEFQKTLNEWDLMESQVNWEEIAKKQEGVINTYQVENEELANICIQRWNEIEHLKYLVSYLEKRIENAAV
jgi:hypothetical protein